MTDIDYILETRGGTHGDFTDNAYFSTLMKDLIREAVKDKHQVLTPVQREALDMISHKISRIVCGDANEPDHWTDIAGYAMLVSDRVSGR